MQGGVNTILGALLAALLLFVSTIVTLFAENPALTFDTIGQATWVSIGGGAIAAFLKDFQALWTRRQINRLTRSGDGGGSV